MRFGADKLAAQLGGEALLAATIRAVSRVSDDLIVAGPSMPAGFRASDRPWALVQDTEPFAGPLAALANVLTRGKPDADDVAIVVGGDMPRLVPGVLLAMLDRLAADVGASAVILQAAGGAHGADAPRQVLPLALRMAAAGKAAADAVQSGNRSLQSLLDRLEVAVLPFSAWHALDPESHTVLDVDTTADLERIAGRQPS
jgi:molybdopterin-guanine dinucleotide biosynthesis protein A